MGASPPWPRVAVQVRAVPVGAVDSEINGNFPSDQPGRTSQRQQSG